MVTLDQNHIEVIPGIDTVEMEQPPSLDYILGLKADNMTYYQAFHSNCKKVDDYFYELNAVPAPQGFDAIRTARARSIINTATDHIDVNNVSIDVPPASPRAKARAERLKKFYQGVWLNIKTPVKRVSARHAFSYGVGVLKTMFNSLEWPDAPTLGMFANEGDYREALEDWQEKRNISNPIIVENVNPQRLLWDDSKIGPKWVIEFYDRSARDIQRRYPQWNRSVEANKEVSWMEYWDEKWVVYIADNEVVWGGTAEEAEHSYGFQPYSFIFPAMGMDWDDRKPDERYQGLLHGIFDMLDEHARILTAHSAILRSYAWVTLDFSGPIHLVEQAKQNYELWGGFNSLPPGVEVRPSPRNMPPPELMQTLATLETQMEEATFPNVVRGIRPRGVSSGFQVSVLAGMGRLVFQGTADGMAHAIEQCNSNFAKLIENKLRGSMTVHARSDIHNFDQTIGPEDIRGYYENIVVLKAESPEEREREALLAKQLLESGIISLYEAQRRAGVVNPLEMQVEQAAERLLLSDTFRMAQEKLAAERLGLLAQQGEATSLSGGGNSGQFLQGLSQLQQPGQANAQRARMDSQAGRPSVFPRGQSEVDILGGLLGNAGGGPIGLPSGGKSP
jgi:hypothetical protein